VTESLDDEIEPGRIVRDAFVIDRDAQNFLPAGMPGLQAQELAAGRYVDLGSGCAVGDPHDHRFAAAMQKEVLHGKRERAAGTVTPKDVTKFRKTANHDRFVDRPALGPAEKADDRSSYQWNWVAAYAHTDWPAGRKMDSFYRHDPSAMEKPIIPAMAASR
jgi:hypothetical protein